QYVLRDSMVMRIGKSSPLPLVNRYKFDPRNGAQFEISAPNGAVTRKTFDDFGRIIELAQSDVNDITLVKSIENYQYDLLGASGQVASNRIVKNIRQDGYPVVEQEITYLDGFFKKIQCKYLASDTTFHGYRTQSYTYGLNGKVERSFQPYFTMEEVFTPIDLSLPNIITHYDALGRVVRLQPDHMSEGDSPMAGETTEYTVSGFQQEQISIKGDHTTRYRYNSGGKITDIFQYVGKEVFHTRYDYDLLDRLTRIVDDHGVVTSLSYDSMDEKREMQDPSTGHSFYFYDGAGNVLRYVDAKKDTTFFQYDELYRILSKRFSADASQTIKYTYDENGFRGFLTKLTSAAVVSSYRYNSLGNIIRQERKIENQNLIMVSEYDPYGRLLRITYPEGSKVSYHYYSLGAQLKEVKLDNVTVAFFEKYNPLMKPLKYRFSNGVSTDNIFFSSNERIKDSSVKDRTGKEIQGFAFRFDDFGNVRFVQNRILQTRRAYDHDALNRLMAADTWTGTNPVAVSENFTYDELGNLTGKDGKAYVYETGRPYIVSQLGNQTFTHDLNGNQTKGSNGRRYKYDVMDRLVEVSDQGNAVVASFKYDASTGRAVKASAGVTTIYFDNLFERRVQGGRNTIHIYALGKIISTVVSNNTPQRLIQFYHQDQLGSITLISGVNGEVTARFDYKPYGEQIHISGAATSSFGFTGQLMDKDIGLIYYQSRYYDPLIGRFIQPDRFIPQPADPQTLNRYTYVGNNPITFVDPTGHWFGVDDLIAFGVGFAVGFTTTLLTSDFNWKLAFYSGLANGLGFWLAFNTLGASALYYYGSAQVLASASNEVFAGDRGGTFGDVVQLVTTFAASPITSTVGLLVGAGFIVFTDRTWSHDFHFVD
ncbi:MAG TPA: RHS repeat-associated core domain-containing protein, partial [Saprospiraceae bacterium]|nr:RHS repeat-associated core domain-containing protein [Saprospiraceae bacterium]